MPKFDESNFQEIIQNDIEINYSEISNIQIDSKMLIITIGTLIFTGYFSQLTNSFPGWIPITLIIIIILSIDQISKDIDRYNYSQYSGDHPQIESEGNLDKRKILRRIDIKTKFTIARPVFMSMASIIFLYFLIFSVYLIQQDLTLPQNRGNFLILFILFSGSIVFLTNLIFPSKHLIDWNVNKAENPDMLKNMVDWITKKILKQGLTIVAYMTPIMLLYLLVVPPSFTSSFSSPFFLIFLIAQFLFWFVLKDIFVRNELNDLIKRKIKWLIQLKDELVALRISNQITPEKLQSLFKKYQITQLFKFTAITSLFFFMEFGMMTYDYQIIVQSSDSNIQAFLDT
jgi:hypothetical protein